MLLYYGELRFGCQFFVLFLQMWLQLQKVFFPHNHREFFLAIEHKDDSVDQFIDSFSSKLLACVRRVTDLKKIGDGPILVAKLIAITALHLYRLQEASAAEK